MFRVLFCLISCFPFFCFAQELNIIQRPIQWNAEREQLSLAYLEQRHGLMQTEANIVPQMIVVYWTAIMSLNRTWEVFYPVRLPGRKDLQQASPLNVSAHYLVDRDGTIVQVLPETKFARHTIGLNYCAIGIENIGSDQYPLTSAQLIANEQLIRHLKSQYPIAYVIGHHEYQKFRQTALWKEKDAGYLTHKTDPGQKFMDSLRKNLADLSFSKLPE